MQIVVVPVDVDFAFTIAVISIPVGMKRSSCPQANFAPLLLWIEGDIVFIEFTDILLQFITGSCSKV